MIVVDIETSGLYPEKHGIWQIGALDFYNPENTFLEEARIDNEDQVEVGALKVTGKTSAYLRNIGKQSEKQLLKHFFTWTKTAKIKNPLCQNPQFDLGFITYKARKYELNYPLHHRAFDLHSIAQLRYSQLNGELLLKENHSDMGLSKILEFCGLEDNRKEHSALEDAKLTAECFSRIAKGISLFSQYSHYKVPGYLK